MLLKLLTSQIAENWGEIELSIRLSIPPHINGRRLNMANSLQSALIGDLEVWSLSYQDKVVGLATTMFTYEPATKEKHLLIYSLASITEETIPTIVWRESYDTLTTYARQTGCKAINAYSKNQHVIEMTKELGGDTDFHFLILEV